MRCELVFSRDEADVALQRLAKADLSRVMAAASRLMLQSVRKNFRDGGRYDRAGSVFGGEEKWLVTNNPKPLVRQGMQGGLMASIAQASDADTAWVTTDKPYAAAHNYGHTYAPRSSLMTRGVNQGFTLPARPFMVIQEEDIEDVKDLIRAHLLGEG